MKKFVFLIFICFVTFCNILFCISKTECFNNLFLSQLEALAEDELGATQNGWLVREQCFVTKEVIVGHWANGVPIIEKKEVEGELGYCLGTSGWCNPYPCTELNY